MFLKMISLVFLQNKLSLAVQLLWKKISSEFISDNKVDSHCPQLCRPADLISSETDNQVLTVNIRANYNDMGSILPKGNIAVLCGRVTLGPEQYSLV